ncbi:hypothetical protein L6R53_16755 [Myxococcota bacterium]|nr:hypothetical protein [Myxococcota bacterium]
MTTDPAVLIAISEDLAKKLVGFRSPGSDRPVDSSMLGTLQRFALTRPSPRDIDAFLKLYPRSSWARYTKSSGPQVRFLCDQLSSVLPRLDQDLLAQEFAWVLGTTRKLMAIQQAEESPVRPERDRARDGRRGQGPGRSPGWGRR